MKKLIIYVLCLLNTTLSGCAQNRKKINPDTDFVEFVNSFDKLQPNDIVNFNTIVNQFGKSMTKKQALRFVYHTDDTTKLYFTEKIFSNETEEVFGTRNELYMPNKIFKIDKNNYSILGYTSYSCEDNSSFPIISNYLHLMIMDNNYHIIDSLIVYRGNEYDSDIFGYLDCNLEKILKIVYSGSSFKNNLTKTAYLYKINSKTLKIELEKEMIIPNEVNPYDLKNVLERLQCEKYFCIEKNK